MGSVAVGLTFSAAFGAIATWRIHHVEGQAVRVALESRLQLAREQLGPDGTLRQDAGSPKTDFVQVLGPDGRTRSSSLALTGVAPLVALADVRASSHGYQQQRALQQPDIDLEVLAVPLALHATENLPAGVGALVVATDAEGFNAASADLMGLLLAGLAAVVVAIAALTWALTGRALRVVTRITESAEAVHPRDRAAGLPIPRGDAELGRLVEGLNRMLGRLHETHATELAFAADAGHRLRTPLATLRAEAELALRETDPHELRAALERVVVDSDQLTSIVDRMLLRSRAGSVLRMPVLQTVESSRARWQRQAELAGVALTATVGVEITRKDCCGPLDEVVQPVIDNAIRHAGRGGRVDLRVRRDRGFLLVEVGNSGDPIPADLAPHVFDAWVSSRDASVAGGLGLWIARETSRELGGDVMLVNGRHATTVRIQLPLLVGRPHRTATIEDPTASPRRRLRRRN